MKYALVRSAVWRPPPRAYVERSVPSPQLVDSHREYISPAFSALAKIIDTDEYENMLAQWRLGLRDIWLENGCVMTCYTPPSKT